MQEGLPVGLDALQAGGQGLLQQVKAVGLVPQAHVCLQQPGQQGVRQEALHRGGLLVCLVPGEGRVGKHCVGQEQEQRTEQQERKCLKMFEGQISE